MRRWPSLVGALALAAWLSGAAHAVLPEEELSDPALEGRARAISAQLRCLVCQNQSIDASDADLAHDLRVLVRERLKAGDTDRQVIDYIVARYGEFVLLKPRFNARNAVLWGAPLVLLVVGGIVLFAQARRRPPKIQALTADEQAALDAILEDGDAAPNITKVSSAGNGAVM